jgi:hypothetical protein
MGGSVYHRHVGRFDELNDELIGLRELTESELSELSPPSHVQLWASA